MGVGRCSTQCNHKLGIILFIKKFFWSLSKKLFNCSNNNSFILKMPLFMMPTLEPLVMRFRYEDFQQKNITQLMKCIWIYSDSHGKRCKVCRTYRLWAISTMKEKWLSYYIDFETTVQKLIARDLQYAYIIHAPSNFSLYLKPIYPATAATATAATAE